MTNPEIVYDISPLIRDAELDELHTAAFGGAPGHTSWQSTLQRYSLFWLTARAGERLVGFVNVLGDGGAHAILLDTCVSPDHQGQGIGAALVERAADEARLRGCQWLHADYEPELVDFYQRRCGLRPTAAGLLRLH